MRAVGIPHRIGLYDGPALPHEIGENGPLDRESEPVLLRQGIGRDVDHQLQLAPVGRADDRGEIGLVGVRVATPSGLPRCNWSSASAQRTRSGTRSIGPVLQTLAPVAAQRAVTTSQFPSQ